MLTLNETLGGSRKLLSRPCHNTRLVLQDTEKSSGAETWQKHFHLVKAQQGMEKTVKWQVSGQRGSGRNTLTLSQAVLFEEGGPADGSAVEKPHSEVG